MAHDNLLFSEWGKYAKIVGGNETDAGILSGVTLVAGGSSELFNVNALYGNVAIGIRLTAATDFTIDMAYRAKDTDNYILKSYTEVVNEVGVDRGVFHIPVDFPHLRFRLANIGTSDVDIDFLQIGHVMK